MYQIGKVYIWQGQVGEYAFLNETETTVLSGPEYMFQTTTGRTELCWETDSQPPPNKPIEKFVMVAFAGDLRPKYPPQGEQLILKLFKEQPEVEVT
jgi:hypothetical protein